MGISIVRLDNPSLTRCSKPMHAPVESDDWVFDTIKPSTLQHQIPKQTVKRRKLSRIPSNEGVEDAAEAMERLELHAAPLASSPAYNARRSSTIQTPQAGGSSPSQRRKSSALTARKESHHNDSHGKESKPASLRSRAHCPSSVRAAQATSGLGYEFWQWHFYCPTVPPSFISADASSPSPTTDRPSRATD